MMRFWLKFGLSQLFLTTALLQGFSAVARHDYGPLTIERFLASICWYAGLCCQLAPTGRAGRIAAAAGIAAGLMLMLSSALCDMAGVSGLGASVAVLAGCLLTFPLIAIFYGVAAYLLKDRRVLPR